MLADDFLPLCTELSAIMELAAAGGGESPGGVRAGTMSQ